MTMVGENIEADVPDAMVDAQVDRFLENFKQQMASQGIPYDQYLKMTGMEESKLKEDAKEPAMKQVRLDLAVAAIIEAEKLEATAEEIEAEYQKFSQQYGMDVELVKKYLPEDQIKAQVLNEKAIAVVRDSAEATAPEEEEKPKKAAKKSSKKDEAEEGEEKPRKTAKKSPKKADEPAEEPAGEPAETPAGE